MSVHKRQLSGKRVSWRYEFAIGPRGAQEKYREGGFATENAAKLAEAAKRLEIERAVKIQATGTLADTLRRFFGERAEVLSPKTLDRYRELASYLNPELLYAPLADVRPLMLHEEWKRLRKSGGRHRKTKEARPLSAKTVRNIAGVVSSACGWAVLWGLIPVNPASDSKPPSGPKKRGIALAPSQTELLTESAVGWLADFLAVETGLGIRRGEALALRWADVGTHPASGNPAVYVSRSLCQVKQQLFWKGLKVAGTERWVEFSASVAAAFARRRAEQATFRAQFPEYDRAADLIFCDEFGAPLKPDSVSSKVSLHFRRLKMAGSLHTLRHTHFSQLIADGAVPAKVAQRAGHHDTATTLGIYDHAIPDGENLGERWAKAQKKPQ